MESYFSVNRTLLTKFSLFSSSFSTFISASGCLSVLLSFPLLLIQEQKQMEEKEEGGQQKDRKKRKR